MYLDINWKTDKLKNLILFTRDGEWGKDQPFYDYIKMGIIRGTDFNSLRNGYAKSVPQRFIKKTVAEQKKLQADDILLETAGGTKDQPTGRSLLVTKSIVSKSEIPLTCASFSRFLRMDKLRIYPSYLFWYFQYLYFEGIMEQHQIQHTGVARFQFTKFSENIDIPLPPLPEQRAIAEILSSIDEKIELNNQMNRTLEATAQAIFKQWFVDFEFPLGYAQGKPITQASATLSQRSEAKKESSNTQRSLSVAEMSGYKSSGGKMIDSELGPIPEGWRVGKLSDIAYNKTNGIKPESMYGDMHYIGLEHMPRKSIALSEWTTAEEVQSNKYLFEVGDILFGKLRPYFHKVVVAPIVGVCSTDILVINSIEPQWHGYISCIISSELFVDYANSSSTGTKMPRTNWEYMSKYPIILPSLNIIVEFNKIMNDFLNRIRNNIFESQTLSTLRDTLLPKLMSGELRVPEEIVKSYEEPVSEA